MKKLIKEWIKQEKLIKKSICTLIEGFETNPDIQRLSDSPSIFIIKKLKVDHYSNLLPEFHDFEYQKRRLLEEVKKKELREIINLIAKIIKEGEMSIKRERIIFHPEFIQKLRDLQP